MKNYFELFTKHLLEDEKPSEYFNMLLDNNDFPSSEPFSILKTLPTIEQEKRHHPEGNVWNHTMEVIDFAAKYRSESQDSYTFMWAALLHDLGKIKTTKLRKGRLTAYDHDKVGATMAQDFLQKVSSNQVFINNVTQLIRWHMQPLFVYKNMPFADIKGMLQSTSIEEIGLLSLCDRLGRGPMSQEKQNEVKHVIDVFLQKCHAKEAVLYR